MTKKRSKSDDEEPYEEEELKTKKSAGKKPRVSPEKAKEVYQKMKDEMVLYYTIGVTDVNMAELANKIGYKNVRSDAIAAAKKLLKADGLGKVTKETCSFTEKGIEELVPKELPPANRQEALDRKWEHLVTKLSQNSKTKGAKSQDAAKKMFDKLLDGKAYTKKELLQVTHYGMERSTGFPETLNAMKDIKMVQVDGGKYSFTDSMFPFGRP